MAELTGRERRKFARLDLALSVSYRILDVSNPTAPDPVESLTSDVSLGGLRLMTPSAMQNGTKLELDIQITEEQAPIKAEAEVVWQVKHSSTSFETGVMIKTMPDADKGRFMSFVFDQMSKLMINAVT